MKYRDYELRRVDENVWEIIQWFPKQLVECWAVVMTLRWNPNNGHINITPVPDRVLQTYSVKNFDKWLDMCLKFVELKKDEEESKDE